MTQPAPANSDKAINTQHVFIFPSNGTTIMTIRTGEWRICICAPRKIGQHSPEFDYVSDPPWQNCQKWAHKGSGPCQFTTRQDPANMLGMTDFTLRCFHVLDFPDSRFPDSQVPRFPDAVASAGTLRSPNLTHLATHSGNTYVVRSQKPLLQRRF